MSSSEAEYRAMVAATSKITWIMRLLNELHVINLKPITLNCDNQRAIHIGKNHVFHERTKHIELDCYCYYHSRMPSIIYCGTLNQTSKRLYFALT